MSAYIMVNFTPADKQKLLQYGASVPATLAKYSGEYLVKGPIEPLSGDAGHPMQVILAFPSRDKAAAWYQSEEYQALIPLRDAAMHSQFMLIGS